MANTARVEITATYRGKEAEKGLKGLQGGVSDLRRAMEALGAVWGIREMARFSAESAKLASETTNVRKVFQSLATREGRDVVTQLNEMRRAVGGTMSDLRLMQKAGAAVDAGLTFDDATTALEFLRRYSAAFGKDFDQLTKTIFLGLQRGSVQFLDDAGIILSASDKMFDGLSDVEKKAALVGEALRQMRLKMDHLPEVQLDAVVASERLSVGLENLKVAFGSLTEEPFVRSVVLLTKGFEELAAAIRSVEKARAQASLNQPDPALKEFFEARLFQTTPSMPGWVAEIRDIQRETQSPFTGWAREIDDARIAAEKLQGSRQEGQLEREAFDRAKRAQQRFLEGQDALYEARQKHERALAEAVGAETIAEMERLAAYQNWAAEVDARERSVHPVFSTVGRPGGMGPVEDQLDEWLSFQQDLTRAEAEASGDRRRIIAAEFEDRITEMEAFAARAGATEGEIAQFRKALRAQEARALKEPLVRQVLLFFDADVSQVKTQSDLAAYSIGLLTEQLRGLDPALAEAIDGVQQIVVGGVTGGAAGTAGIIAGAVGLSTQLMGALLRKTESQAQRFEREMDRVADALDAASYAGGSFATNLNARTFDELTRAFGQTGLELAKLTGQGSLVSGAMEGWTFNAEEFLRVFATLRDNMLMPEAQVLIQELERIEERLARFSGGVFTFQDALADYNHQIALLDIQDPTRELEELDRALRAVGITIADGLSAGELSSLSLPEQRQLKELIAQLGRDVVDAEMEARRDQASKIIATIEDQERLIEEAINDQAEAQKQAALRAVSARFELEEAAIRTGFLPRLVGASTDPLETARIIAEAQREIALLQLAEEATGARELAAIRIAAEAARAAAGELTDRQIDAINTASETLGLTFNEALEREVGKLEASGSTKLAILANIGSAMAGKIDLLSTQSIISAVGGLQAEVVNALGALKLTTPQEEILATERMLDALVGVREDLSGLRAEGLSTLGEIARYQSLAVTELASANRVLQAFGVLSPALVENIAGMSAGLAMVQTLEGYSAGWLAAIYGQNSALIAAVNDPAWARGRDFGGGAGGGSVTLQVNTTVQGGGGAPTRAEAKDLYDRYLEDFILVSMHEGRIALGMNLLGIPRR